MAMYIVRRLIAGFFVILGASFIVFILVANAGDPLEQAQGITDPIARQQRIDYLTATLSLDVNPVLRYFVWLKGVGGCFIGQCDFGFSISTNQPVTGDLGSRILITLKLVLAASMLAVIIGVAIGIITALKQYSGFDYTITFFTFLFFSLPVFWVAVLLKELAAIQFNDFIADGAYIPWWFIWLVTLVVFLITYSISGGQPLRRGLYAIGASAVTFGIVYYMSVTQWLLDPGLGPVVIAVTAIAIAVAVTELSAGLSNRKALYTAMTTAGVGIVLWYPLQFVFYENMSSLRLLLMAAAAVGIGIGIGYLWGGDDRGLSARTGAITAFGISVLIFLDRAMQAWSAYTANEAIRGRPIKTIGDSQAGLEGDFWIQTVDVFTHLLLPTMALILISLASYTRYSRASMLEVLNQDYIRTARAKGLTERTVIMRHAFRNALIPLATIVAFDIGQLLGGAVITEKVFQWDAMGTLFLRGLQNSDPNPVMAFFLIVAIVAVIFNIIADLLYAALDPRIRVGQ
ncbi:MAG TPA: ABC transporter permease [Mycobacterium sp.]